MVLNWQAASSLGQITSFPQRKRWKFSKSEICRWPQEIQKNADFNVRCCRWYVDDTSLIFPGVPLFLSFQALLLWMEEILHQLVDGLSHYLWGFNHPFDGAGFLPSTVSSTFHLFSRCFSSIARFYPGDAFGTTGERVLDAEPGDGQNLGIFGPSWGRTYELNGILYPPPQKKDGWLII